MTYYSSIFFLFIFYSTLIENDTSLISRMHLICAMSKFSIVNSNLAFTINFCFLYLKYFNGAYSQDFERSRVEHCSAISCKNDFSWRTILSDVTPFLCFCLTRRRYRPTRHPFGRPYRLPVGPPQASKTASASSSTTPLRVVEPRFTDPDRFRRFYR